MLNKILDFMFQPQTLQQVFLRVGIFLLAGMLLCFSVKMIDGDGHRLGTITLEKK